jgi:hypothetical protein
MLKLLQLFNIPVEGKGPYATIDVYLLNNDGINQQKWVYIILVSFNNTFRTAQYVGMF